MTFHALADAIGLDDLQVWVPYRHRPVSLADEVTDDLVGQVVEPVVRVPTVYRRNDTTVLGECRTYPTGGRLDPDAGVLAVYRRRRRVAARSRTNAG